MIFLYTSVTKRFLISVTEKKVFPDTVSVAWVWMKDGGPTCLTAVGSVWTGTCCLQLHLRSWTGLFCMYLVEWFCLQWACKLSKMICCCLDHRITLGHIGNNFLTRTNLGRIQPCYAKAGNVKVWAYNLKNPCKLINSCFQLFYPAIPRGGKANS